MTKSEKIKLIQDIKNKNLMYREFKKTRNFLENKKESDYLEYSLRKAFRKLNPEFFTVEGNDISEEDGRRIQQLANALRTAFREQDNKEILIMRDIGELKDYNTRAPEKDESKDDTNVMPMKLLTMALRSAYRDIDDSEEMLVVLREQNEILKQQTQVLKELQAFWSKIVSDEYFNEMMQSDGLKLPK